MGLSGLAAAFLVTVGIVSAQSSDPPPPVGDVWGSTRCSNTPSPECDLEVGTRGGEGGFGNAPGDGEPPRPASNGGGGGRAADVPACRYVRSDFQAPVGGLAPGAGSGPETGEEGAWYVWRCFGVESPDAFINPPVWIPDGEQPGAGPSAEELAQRARDQLRLGAPSIAASPAGDQLVNLPTWMWLAEGWAPVSATASVPGVSVTATATPTSVTWAMGDGQTVTCAGPGTPFAPGGDPTEESPDCGYTYRRSSAAQPGQAYAVSATVNWTVTWAGAGEDGTFPDLTTTGTAQFRVAEAQSLNNGG